MKTQEELNQIENECRCRLIYIGINDLIPCPCGECKDNEMLKAYNKETQQRVESEFLESDIYKGLVLLKRARSLLKKKGYAVKNMQHLLQKYNNDRLGLSPDILTEVWRIAVGRSSHRVQRKVMSYTARTLSEKDEERIMMRRDGTVVGKNVNPTEYSLLGIDPKNVERWRVDEQGMMYKEDDQRNSIINDIVSEEIKRQDGVGKHESFIIGPDMKIVDPSELGIDLHDQKFLESIKKFKVDKRGWYKDPEMEKQRQDEADQKRFKDDE